MIDRDQKGVCLGENFRVNCFLKMMELDLNVYQEINSSIPLSLDRCICIIFDVKQDD